MHNFDLEIWVSLLKIYIEVFDTFHFPSQVKMKIEGIPRVLQVLEVKELFVLKTQSEPMELRQDFPLSKNYWDMDMEFPKSLGKALFSVAIFFIL